MKVGFSPLSLFPHLPLRFQKHSTDFLITVTSFISLSLKLINPQDVIILFGVVSEFDASSLGFDSFGQEEGASLLIPCNKFVCSTENEPLDELT